MVENQWYGILPSSEVKKGGVTAVRRMGLDLAFFRSEKGVLGCVTDRCSHRGASLGKGSVCGDALCCPFHGLRFQKNGTCSFVPADGKASTADLSKFQVTSHVVIEKQGIIFIWYGQKDKIKESPGFFQNQLDDSWVYSEIKDQWQAHYSRCIENQLDVVHLPFVHRTTIGRGGKTLVNGPKIIIDGKNLITCADNELDLGQTPRKADLCTINSTYLHFCFPNIWMNHISDKAAVAVYFAPVDDEHTILYLRFYSKIGKTKLANWAIAQAGKVGNLIIERQDKRIVVTQNPKISTLVSDEHLLSGDRPIIEYRKMRQGFIVAANQGNDPID